GLGRPPGRCRRPDGWLRWAGTSGRRRGRFGRRRRWRRGCDAAGAAAGKDRAARLPRPDVGLLLLGVAQVGEPAEVVGPDVGVEVGVGVLLGPPPPDPLARAAPVA